MNFYSRFLLLFGFACSSPHTANSASGGAGGSSSSATDPFAARPYQVHAPPSYDANTPTPLVVMLHGYSADGPSQESGYFLLTPTSDAKGFLYAYPDGSLDTSGNRFWNATDACCNFDGSSVDDVAYLDAVLAQISARYNVDSTRIFFVGHSNGAFMAHRYACDRSERVAAIVSVAGAQWNDPARCNPKQSVSVVEMHGTIDGTSADTTTTYGVLYDGGSIYQNQYPSAPTTVATWAAKNGCSGALAAASGALDLIPSLSGAETSVQRNDGCPADVGVELWSVVGGGHMNPLDTSAFGEAMWAFMSAHPKKN